MRTIYYKEAPEFPENLGVILKDYFEKGSPVTYWSDTNEMQCSSYRHRSPDDLLFLANHYFPGTTIKEMMNAYKKINEDYIGRGRTLMFSFCSDMNKPRLRKRLELQESMIHSLEKNLVLTSSDYSLTKGNSQWCLKELADMIDD